MAELGASEGGGLLEGGGSMDLGFLDELIGSEGISMDQLSGMHDEVVPVDTFFDDYVTSLGAAAAFDGQQPRVQPPDFDLNTGLAPSLQEDNIAASSGTTTALPQLYQNGMESAPFVDTFVDTGMPSSTLHTGQSPQWADIEASALVRAASSSAMPFIPQSPTDASGTHTSSVPQSAHQHMGGSSGDDALHRIEHDKTKRSSKQQQQNKQAQQRYRQRRKQRFEELEGALGELSQSLKDKTKEVSQLGSHNASLEGKTRELSLALASKQTEIENLRTQIVSLQATCVSASRQRGHDSSDGGQGQQGTPLPDHSAALTSDDVSRARQEHDTLVTSMRHLAEAYGLRVVNPLGEGVDANILAQVRDLVGRACRSNQLLERKGGVHVLEVMSRRSDAKLGQVTCTQERARWASLTATLRLAPRQEEALLALRKQHLAKLASIYEHRQRLNSEAMGMMLPGREAGAGQSLSTKIACMSISGYTPCAGMTSQLYQVLDLVKDNLREEQKAVMEMKLVVLHRVLSPIQCLLLVVDAHPSRPDALALSNSVAFKLGRATEDFEKAAQLLNCQGERALRQGSATSTLQYTKYSAGALEPVSDGSSHRSDSCATGM